MAPAANRTSSLRVMKTPFGSGPLPPRALTMTPLPDTPVNAPLTKRDHAARSASGVHLGHPKTDSRPREVRRDNPHSVAMFEAGQDSNGAAKPEHNAASGSFPRRPGTQSGAGMTFSPIALWPPSHIVTPSAPGGRL